jgi:hypothetical protein
MTRDMIIGMCIIAGGLCCMTYLILWSRKTIRRIADMSSGTLRDIQKELHHGG